MTSHQRGVSAPMGRERRLGRLFVAILAAALAACAHVNLQEPMKPSAAASSTKGYLYGRFNLDSDTGYRIWIRLENVDTRRTFEIPFQDLTAPAYAIEVEPGTYRITEFVQTAAGPASMLTEYDVKKMPIPPTLNFISRRVLVEAGKGYYLGDFFATSKRSGMTVTPLFVVVKYQSGILQFHQNFDVTSKALKERYPSLANVELQPAFG